MVLAMGARTRRFTSFAAGSGKATAVVVCAVMLLAGCGGSGGSATDASTPVIRGDVNGAATESTVTFEAEGGSGTMADQTASGETALTENSFTYPGYVFDYWASNLTGNYADGSLYTFGENELNPLGENDTLYAQWVPSPSVTFDGNGGVNYDRLYSGRGNPVQYATGLAPLDANSFTRRGYAFAGWATTPTGSVAYTERASYLFAGNVTLYAQWSQGGIVTFNGNGATSGDMMSMGGNGPAPLLRNDFTRTGCTFAGWATTPLGSVEYADRALYPFNEGPVTLYAQWGCTATNLFIANDGSGQKAGASCFNSCTLPTIAQLGFEGPGTGYSFAGWATTPTGSVTYNDGASFVSDGGGSTTLYAKWGCLPLSVTASAKRIGANRAEVTFTAPKSESPWTSFAAYAAKEGGKGATVNTSSTTGTISVNGLDKNSGYTFDVTATNAAGCVYTAQANRVVKW